MTQKEIKNVEERSKDGHAVIVEDKDLTSLHLDGLQFHGVTFNRVIFSDDKPDRRRTWKKLEFRDHCTLTDCQFTFNELHEAHFRGAQVTHCDFRYATFRSSTFSEARLESCDFYRACFEGNNVFDEARIKLCSLYLASLSGADLHRDNFDGPLIQEHRKEYEKFLRSAKNLGGGRAADIAALGPLEAKNIYRVLSGDWSTKGYFEDSTWAYVRTKRMERQCKSPYFAYQAPIHRQNLAQQRKLPLPHASGRTRRCLRALASLWSYLLLWFTDWTCEFGTSLVKVTGTILQTILVFAVVYRLGGAVQRIDLPNSPAATFLDCLELSFYKLCAATPPFLHITNSNYDVLGTFETAIGFGLIGLFGFVLGDSIRHS